MIELAVFLGNPGREYSRNRHNAGFLLADTLPLCADLSWQKKFKGSYAALDGSRLADYAPGGLFAGKGGALPKDTFPAPEVPARLHFIKPATYMNLSGESAAAAAAFFKIKSDSILAVHDELELPLGTVSLKSGGGLGGHNGLRSMKACLGTADFWRVRIGIGRPDSRLPGEGGRPGSGEGIADWVLSDFGASERETLDKVLETAGELLLLALARGPETLLPEWAKKRVSG